MICDHKDLAKTSSKPGKTQHIVRFSVDNKWFLVDLPGYGYAKVSKESREKFGRLIQDYILDRESLFCLFVLIDSRLEPQKIDLKLKPSELEINVKNYQEKLLETWEFLPDIFITSAEKKVGKDELLKFINNILKNAK
jgi:GTP-binding protein